MVLMKLNWNSNEFVVQKLAQIPIGVGDILINTLMSGFLLYMLLPIQMFMPFIATLLLVQIRYGIIAKHLYKTISYSLIFSTDFIFLLTFLTASRSGIVVELHIVFLMLISIRINIMQKTH